MAIETHSTLLSENTRNSVNGVPINLIIIVTLNAGILGVVHRLMVYYLTPGYVEKPRHVCVY